LLLVIKNKVKTAILTRGAVFTFVHSFHVYGIVKRVAHSTKERNIIMTTIPAPLQELSSKGLPIAKEVLDNLYSLCGYTPSHEISELLNTEKNIFPPLQ
jgi:hypothetical protein